MHFPPLKADRAMLTITLHPDEQAATRYAALVAVLKTCRLHPLDTTSCSEIVIVERDALHAKIDAVRDTLGPQDILHLTTAQADGRLRIQAITGVDAAEDRPAHRPAERQPPWRQA